MASTNELIDRGMRGRAPAATTHDDEAALDFMSEVKNILFYAQMPWVLPDTAQALKEKGVEMEHSQEGVESIRAAVKDFRPATSWLRVMRTSQDVTWNRATETVNRRRNEYMEELEKADRSGPGSLSYDPDFDMPEYAKVEIHTQPGGYVGDPLAGYVFEHGTRVFYGGAIDDDALHLAVVNKTTPPVDGKVDRILDVACSVGQFTGGLKERFPEAEVWGTDISAPMVRYAHKRAIDLNLDIHYSQMAVEDMSAFPDNHFDLVTAYILFHELPVPIIDKAIQEIYRVLRPGGTFVMWDFPSEEGDLNALDYTGFLGTMDASDNCEPYAPGFIRCGVEKRLTDTGFSIRFTDPETMNRLGRICDKPAGGAS